MAISYTKQTWVDKETHVNAERMQHIENGIADVTREVNNLPSGTSTSLTIGTVTSGTTAGATITNGKLNLVLPKGPAGAEGPGFTDNAKTLIIDLFASAAYGNSTMQTKLDALKTEWGKSTDNGGGTDPDPTPNPPDTEDVPGETPVYKLAQAKNFVPANKECIDTGIKMLANIDPKPAYTILFEVQFNESSAAKASTHVLFHCMEETDPYPGFTVQVGSSGVLQVNMYDYVCVIDDRADLVANKRRFAIQFYDSKIKGMSHNGNWFTGGANTGYAGDITGYTTAVTKSLILGAFQESDGTKGRFFDGTLYQCLVYDKALTEDQLSAWIAG